MKSEQFKKYLILVVIALGAGVIYKVAYLREVFYDAMLEGFGITNSELGTLSSIYGTVSLFCYIPGGILADRISYKKLLAFSFISTGLLALWCSTMPSFGTVKIIFGLMAITTVLTYWSAFIKTIRSLGDENEQGRMFGLTEGIRGVSGIIGSFIAMAILETAVNAVSGMKTTILFYGIVYILVGVSTVFLLPKEEKVKVEKKESLNIGEMLSALKCKGVWLVSGIIFFWYLAYSATSYSIPYLTNVYGASSVLISAISVIRAYGIGILAAPVAGFSADKIGSCSKALGYYAILGTIVILSFFLIPITSNMLNVAIIVTLLFSFIIFAARGIYFSPMSEVGIPMELTGAASGIISILGYLPDMFIFNIMGGWLDKYPGVQGYRYIFILTAISLLCAFGMCIYSYIYGKKIKNL